MPPFRIHSAEFVKSCGAVEQFPQNRLPEIAMVGRSNVGKSSAINCLLNRQGLAKVGKVPGKTQTINFYKVQTSQGEFGLVDLPGYGFAKVPDHVRKQWIPLIEQYFHTRSTLHGVIFLVDVRRTHKQDRDMREWLDHLQIPNFVVATKVDKVTRGNRAAAIRDIRRELNLPVDPLILSAHTGEGKQSVLDRIPHFLPQKIH